jgi:predicted O-linked N-acetylglucosamine transferase (SPINDLY family)
MHMHNTPVDPYLPTLREALALQKQNQWTAAEAGYREVLARCPDHAMALHLLGVVLGQTGRASAGADCLRKSVAHNPQDPLAWNNLANTLKQLGELEEAAQAYEHAVALHPGYLAAWCSLGEVSRMLQHDLRALAAYQHAVALAPQHLDALLGCVCVLLDLGRSPQALVYAQQAVRVGPDHGAANRGLGVALSNLKQYPEAAHFLRKSLQIDPQGTMVLGTLMYADMVCCNWHGRAESLARIEADLMQGRWVAEPFVLLGCSGSAALLRACAELKMQATVAVATPRLLHVRANASRNKLRIAYLSADFHTHATSYLMAELFELHDRDRFEVVAVSFGPDDDGPLRKRIEAAVGQFFRANDLSDQEVAQWLVREQVDIAIDLKGFTLDSRPGIFQYRPAPIVVNYLGYPGTMGAPCYDYILGDPVVTPFAHADHYSEKIVQLPHSYQVNDRQRAIAAQTPTRQQQGLPDEGFVFACFNNNYKITPEVFGIWMRLLAQVQGSVLWLLADNDAAVAHLRSEATARGIDSRRLVFAPRAPLPEHLARHRLADLFLDTLPYNAHTTASDALWAGLPVLTCLGASFAGRVAASLLRAAGLPELVATSLADYEALAFALATTPGRLAALRARLERSRLECPLFDTAAFVRSMERAYEEMVRRARAGETHRGLDFSEPNQALAQNPPPQIAT